MNKIFGDGKFIKGLGMMAAIIYAAIQAGTNIWPVAVLVAIATGAGYYLSNYWVTSTSAQGSISWPDLLKGALLAAFTVVVQTAATYLDGTTFAWKQLLVAFGTAFISYVFPTLFTGQPKTTNSVADTQPPVIK